MMHSKNRLSLLLIGIAVAFYCIYATISDHHIFSEITFIEGLSTKDTSGMIQEYSKSRSEEAINPLLLFSENKPKILPSQYSNIEAGLYVGN